jgi:hypothetical protein
VNCFFGLVRALGLSRRLGTALCLGLALAGPAAADDAQGAHDTGTNDVHRAHEGRPDARPDAKPSIIPNPAPDPQPETSAPPPEPPRAEAPSAEPVAASSAFVQGQDSQAFMAQPSPRKRARTKAQTRLSGLAVMAARIATRANLTGAGTFEAPRDMANPSERRVLLRRPEPTVQPPKPEAAPPPASVGVLDEGIVKEIVQRKTMFRMCYESARRRGVTVTRADVRWTLSSDGSVRDVAVEVAQDELLSRCIRVIASRPFATTVPQEIPVTIPLLFVSER